MVQLISRLWLFVALVIAMMLLIARSSLLLPHTPFDRTKLVATDPTPEWCAEVVLAADSRVIYFLNQGSFLYQHPDDNWLYAAPQIRFDLGQFRVEPIGPITDQGQVTLRSLSNNRLIKVEFAA
jgi:hypothetical protein